MNLRLNFCLDFYLWLKNLHQKWPWLCVTGCMFNKKIPKKKREKKEKDLFFNSLFSRDLRNNQISRIEPGAFLGLPALKRL